MTDTKPVNERVSSTRDADDRSKPKEPDSYNHVEYVDAAWEIRLGHYDFGKDNLITTAATPERLADAVEILAREGVTHLTLQRVFKIQGPEQDG